MITVLNAEGRMRSARMNKKPRSRRVCILHFAFFIQMEPLVGLAPTNTSLRNSPCSCWRHRGVAKSEGIPKLEGRMHRMANSGFGLGISFGFRPSDFGFPKWHPWPDLHRLGAD